MALTEVDPKKVPKEKRSKVPFKCCKTKNSGVFVCIKCGKTFHPSCAVRDWSKKLIFIDRSRVLCCGEDDLTSENQIVNNEENRILRELNEELKSKNQLLEENKRLLEEKIVYLMQETKSKTKTENKSVKSQEIMQPATHAVSGTQILIPEDISLETSSVFKTDNSKTVCSSSNEPTTQLHPFDQIITSVSFLVVSRHGKKVSLELEVICGGLEPDDMQSSSE